MKSHKHILLTAYLSMTSVLACVTEVSCQPAQPASATSQPVVNQTQNQYPALIYYHLLNDKQKVYYKKLHSAFLKAKLVITIPNVELEPDEWQLIYSSVLNDHPEIFWYNNSFHYTVSYDNDLPTTELHPYQNDLYNNLEQNKKLFTAAVDKILSIARNYDSAERKEKYIHDYLNRTIDYEHTPTDQTAFAALVEHKCVCRGYAAAFTFLMNQLGVTTWTTSGAYYTQDSNEPVAHAWNIIEIDGTLYNVDVTANQLDRNHSFRNLNLPSYSEFNRSDDYFKKKGYVREPELRPFMSRLPQCTSDNYKLTKHFTETEIINTYAYSLPIQPVIVKSKDEYIKLVISALAQTEFVDDVRKLEMFFLVSGKDVSDFIYNLSHEDEKKAYLQDYAYDKNYSNRKSRTDDRIKIAEGLFLHRMDLTVTRYK